MSFISTDENKAETNKQHINLSTTAYEIINNDMFMFGENTISGFINKIFELYAPDAQASIAITLNNYLDSIENALDNIKGDEKQKSKIISKLIEQKADQLITMSNSYSNGVQFKIWLNTKNFEYLTSEMSGCHENLYYRKRGKYIKCVIEEYSRLPFFSRELIYLSHFVKEIQLAIENKKQLNVKTGNNNIFRVIPYKIMHDPLSSINYIVGLSISDNNSIITKTPCSFRLSALKAVKCLKSQPGKIKEDEATELDKKIRIRGVQFMLGQEVEICVRLTDAGVHRYFRNVHLRPTFIKKTEPDIYTFECTEAQAEYYFFKFGENAEILKPEHLRNKFQQMYSNATNKYNKNT